MKNPLHEGSLYTDKETRNRLGRKSLLCFGARNKWFKLCKNTGLTPEQAEIQMDAIIKYRQEQINELRKKNRASTEGVTTTERSEARSTEAESITTPDGGAV